MSILTTLKSLFGNTKIIYGYTNEELPIDDIEGIRQANPA